MPEDRKAWLEARRTGLGGSDMGPVMGASAFKTTPMDIYNSKVLPVVDSDPTPDMERGRVLEPVAVELYKQQSNRMVRRQPMRRHKEHDWMIGDIDRQQIKTERGPGVLEVKVPRSRTVAKLKAEGLHLQYSLQIQHYLEVFGYDWGTFCLLDADNWKLLKWDIERDHEIGEMIVESGQKFWRDHVASRVPPEEPIGPDLSKMPQIKGDITPIDSEDFAKLLADMWESRELLATMKGFKEAADDKVKAYLSEFLGGYGAVETPNDERLYLKSQSGRRTLQKKILAGMAPLDSVTVATILKSELEGMVTEQSLGIVMERLHDEARIDIEDDKFYKIGPDFDRFTPYRLKRVVEEE